MIGRKTVRAAILVGALIALSADGADVPMKIENAKLEQRSAVGGLAASVRELAERSSPAWVAYSVPMVSGDHELCCWNSGGEGVEVLCGQCQLEEGYSRSINTRGRKGTGVAELEASHNLLVFFKLEDHVVDDVRAFSEDCRIDAGGRTVYWLSNVHPSDSVTVLASFAMASGSELVNAADLDRIRNGAVMAIAFHADPSAERTLESFVAASQPEKLREQTAFWLASIRGHAGYETLRRLARADSDFSFRKKLMFDFYVSKDPEAVGTLIDSAQNDSSPYVRGQALFWLAQKAGQKAAPTISEAIKRDPDTEVKKRAVFALSQLPKDQGVPLLIRVARSSTNPAVRKAAMFWLGQSGDPRALAFFEQTLDAK
jgi:HEAT repeat protein